MSGNWPEAPRCIRLATPAGPCARSQALHARFAVTTHGHRPRGAPQPRVTRQTFTVLHEQS